MVSRWLEWAIDECFLDLIDDVRIRGIDDITLDDRATAKSRAVHQRTFDDTGTRDHRASRRSSSGARTQHRSATQSIAAHN
jgi:hypothetical protein